MEFSRDLTTQLDVLTEALDGSGDDLATILGVLVDDLSVGISSFVGLSVTVSVDGEPVTVTAMNPTAAGSVLLPLAAGNQVGHVVLYAQNRGAFTDLAADVQFALGPGGDIIVDGHLPPPTESATHHNVERLTDRSTIDQALGYLIGQGYPPDQAQVELAHPAAAARLIRAAPPGLEPMEVLRLVLDEVASTRFHDQRDQIAAWRGMINADDSLRDRDARKRADLVLAAQAAFVERGESHLGATMFAEAGALVFHVALDAWLAGPEQRTMAQTVAEVIQLLSVHKPTIRHSPA